MPETHPDQLCFDLPGASNEAAPPHVSTPPSKRLRKQNSTKAASDSVIASTEESRIKNDSRTDLTSHSKGRDQSGACAPNVEDGDGRRNAAVVCIEQAVSSRAPEVSVQAPEVRKSVNVEVGICDEVPDSTKTGGTPDSDRLVVDAKAPEHSTEGSSGSTPEPALGPIREASSEQSPARDRDCSAISIGNRRDQSECAPELQSSTSEPRAPEQLQECSDPVLEADLNRNSSAPEPEVESRSSATPERTPAIEQSTPGDVPTAVPARRSRGHRGKAKRSPKRAATDASTPRKRIKHQTGLDAIEGCRFDISIERADAEILRSVAAARRISYRVLLREIVHGWASAANQSLPGYDAQAKNQNV